MNRIRKTPHISPSPCTSYCHVTPESPYSTVEHETVIACVVMVTL